MDVSATSPTTCGTRSGYRGGCRCAACRKWNSDFQREWRRNNRQARREPPKHGASAYANYGCTCNVCSSAHAQQLRATPRRPWSRTDASKRVKLAGARRVNAETRERAHRHGAEWTGPELELITRGDMTAREVASLLGRTVVAVRNKRRKLDAGEPIPTWLAGQRSRLH